MMSSVIPARLVFQCGHAPLVSLPRIKGESNSQRAERVAREKSAAYTRACDFCAQRLEVVVQQAAPAPTPAPVTTPRPPVESAASAPITPAETEAAVAPVASLPLAEWHAERMAQAKPRAPARPKAVPVAKRRVGRPRRVAPPVAPAAKNGTVAARTKSSARNGRVARGARFTVQFQVQTVLRAADMREALRQVQSLGAIEVLAITREN